MDRVKESISQLFDHQVNISSSQINFKAEVRALCEQNHCGCFGKSWTCPPAVGSIADLQARLLPFSRVVVVSKIYQLTDSFDWEGMQESIKDFQSRIARLQGIIENMVPGLDCVLLGAGTCTVCETCTFPLEEPCRNPDKAIISVEACGIDVMELMKDIGLKYNNGPNTVTYVGAIFF